MNVVDALIVVAGLAAVVNGYYRGLWVSLAQYAGVLGGLGAGAVLAPMAGDALQMTDPGRRQLLAIVVVVAAILLGVAAGVAAARPLRRWLLQLPLAAMVDSLLGAALSLAVTLSAAWLVALSLDSGPSPAVARMIQQSAIIRRLDEAAPEPPAFVARLEAMLSARLGPEIFAGLEPSPSRLQPLPETVRTPGVLAAAAVTVRVEGLGCGGRRTGSGFPVAAGLVVTNAHVVAGARNLAVTRPGGAPRAATLVLFDPERDLAFLEVDGLGLEPLRLGSGERGMAGAAIGYPGGGPEQVVPAVVDAAVEARGRDIYNAQLVTRQVLVIEAAVRPGNSGGPLVDAGGTAIGVVFAQSTAHEGEAFALAAGEVATDLRRLQAGEPTIDPRAGECAG
ncbi:MAG: MarP family serine protease [Dehalococcoidia bacterium]|nr:MarP family serine protease [Dehalococcoidia bacterium]